MDEIVRYDPFLAYYDSYQGYTVRVTFRCPYCGSSSCVRSQNSHTNHFFEGHFRCKVCRKGSISGEPFYYASSCFISSHDEIVEQLTLF